jgi:hypothetical protein
VPDARLLVLETVGHVAMLEAPEETARAVLGLLEDTAGQDGTVQDGTVQVGAVPARAGRPRPRRALRRTVPDAPVP